MAKRDWFWTVIWLLLLIAAFGIAGKDDCEREQREAAYYEAHNVPGR